MLSGKILITGGSGFLGRGILRKAKHENWPAQFTVYSRDELKQDQCKRKFPDVQYVLGSITDAERLTVAMMGHDYVIHAAALKYIPEGEFNANECVSVNVDGARTIIRAARAANIKKVVGISTDKAVNPINVYGMTKALMERLFAEAADKGGTVFTTCRYGNVVGSTGSVIPVFRRQIEENGQVTITNGAMTRFWISVDEAVELIVEAFSDKLIPGTTLIPEPRSMKLEDLAWTLIDPNHRFDLREISVKNHIRVIGLRPGEKMHEELLHPQEALRTYKRGKFFHLRPVGNEWGMGVDFPDTLSSATPIKWIERSEMRSLINDAALV